MLRFARLPGLLVLVWGLRAVVEALVTGEAVWGLSALLWLVAAGYLLAVRLVPFACLLVLVLIAFEMTVREVQLSGLHLLAWLVVIVGVSEGRPTERALLLRTAVTVVYTFTAISKLNPSWLAGDGVTGLIAGQSQLEAFQFVADTSELAVAMAIGVICLEGWMAVGLWHRRTRIPTAVVGVLLHIALVTAASPNLWAAVHLSVFNFGLVACYPAFWATIRKSEGDPGPATPLSVESSTSLT